MKLRKQTRAKAVLIAVTIGLLGAFLALVKSEPRIEAGSATPAPSRVDYDRFFAPGVGSVERSPQAPHTRTHAS